MSATKGSRFLLSSDGTNRVHIPRGVSFSSSTKVPQNEGADFFDHRNASFVGRPVALEEAEEHLQRLKWLGFDFVRLVIPWEAIEHTAPGVYDESYITYLSSLLSLFPKYNLTCYIDVHQDVWSRHCGGSGAPGWTLELAGLDMKNFKATGAAFVASQEEEKADIWPSGYQKLAAATMFTLFFASTTLAPTVLVPRSAHANPSIFPSFSSSSADAADKIPIETFLQYSLIAAFRHLLLALRRQVEVGTIIGIGPLNEPHRGYIDLFSPLKWDYNTDLHIGAYPNALQGMRLASGQAVEVPVYERSWPFPTRKKGTVLMNTVGKKAWMEGREEIWRAEGVWEESKWMREGYFEKDWWKECWWTFCRKFEDGLNDAWPKGKEGWVFSGGIPNEFFPATLREELPKRMIAAPHFYDLNVLFSKQLGTMSVNVQGLSRGMFILKALYFGLSGLKRNYELQVKNIVHAAYKNLGELPVIIAECGVPMDINRQSAFRTGYFKWQERMMDAILSAMESNLVPCCIWNYNPYNTDEKGDEWNEENFSFWSISALKTLDKGASAEEQLRNGLRLINAIQRPHASKVAGIPTKTTYDKGTRKFTFSFRNAYCSEHPQDSNGVLMYLPFEIKSKMTEIYFPERVYGKENVKFEVSDGMYKWDHEEQRILWMHEEEAEGYEHRFVAFIDVQDRMMKGRGLMWWIVPILLSLLAMRLMQLLPGLLKITF
ncbi:glycoside hydrolase family 5 protein [Atractiella rhizophila]|nr:glycoside hydrolase family 5 protein [Atractiella rhizophila]